jgi:hypothetical protein
LEETNAESDIFAKGVSGHVGLGTGTHAVGVAGAGVGVGVKVIIGSSLGNGSNQNILSADSAATSPYLTTATDQRHCPN